MINQEPETSRRILRLSRTHRILRIIMGRTVRGPNSVRGCNCVGVQLCGGATVWGCHTVWGCNWGASLGCFDATDFVCITVTAILNCFGPVEQFVPIIGG